MKTYRLEWEMPDGASGLENYADDLEALDDLEDLIEDGAEWVQLMESETYGGMVVGETIIREYQK